MSSTVSQVTEHRDRYLTSADAFLLTGALFLLLLGVMGLVFHEPSIATQVFGQAMFMGSVVAGVILAWMLHGHRLRGATWVGLLIGAVVGGALLIPAFFAVFMLGSFVPSPFPDAQGPWGAILLLSAVVIAFLVPATYQAARSLVTRTGDLRIAVVRLIALAVVVAAVVVTALIGGETAEAGIFMVPVAAAAAVSVAGVAWFEGWRARRRLSHPMPST